MSIKIVEDAALGLFNIILGDKNVGVFTQLDNNVYSYFPRLQERLTGDHYIEIGKALNDINKTNNGGNTCQSKNS